MTKVVTNPTELLQRLAGARGGERILLSGRFGSVRIENINVAGGVTLAAAEPGSAHFERIGISRCSGLTLSGLRLWPGEPVERSRAKLYLITADARSSNIEVEGCLFRGREDSDRFAYWSKEDWIAAKIGGVFLRGPHGVVRNNVAIGVNFGFNVTGDSSELFSNRVFGFSGDGLRVAADNCVVIGNRVSDAVQIDGNHPDGFQSFKTDGLLNGLVVKDNTILEWTVQPTSPLRTRLQGISLHDGPYANVVIRDNSVACSSPNGIRVNAVTNVEIVGNRVRHIDRKPGKDPKIRVTNCSGTIVVTDNQAEKFILPRTAIAARNRRPDYRVEY